MTDTVIVALIGALTTLAVSWFGWYTSRRAAVAIATKVAETAEKVEEVHQATNSMKDALVKATHIAALAAGIKQGVREEKARRARRPRTKPA